MGTDNKCTSMFDNLDLLTRVPSFGAEKHKKWRSLNTTVLPPTGLIRGVKVNYMYVNLSKQNSFC